MSAVVAAKRGLLLAPDETPTEAVVVPAPTPTVEVVVKQPVAAADGIRDAVASRSGVIGELVKTLDDLALHVGSSRVSIWDLLVVVIVITAVITAAWFTSRMVRRLLLRITRLDLAQELLAEKLINLFVWIVAILIGIDILGIDLTAFAIFSGALGLAIGFGLQRTFGNLIAGIILLLDRSIKPGDVIAIADQSGQSTVGQIRRIGIRAVSLTTRDQKEYLIPNENLMINQVENWSYSSKNVRIQVPVRVAFNSDIGRAEELMLEAVHSAKRVLNIPPPTVWIESFGPSSVDFVIHCWIKDPEEGIGNVRSEVLKKLWRLFKDNGIEVPFPQQDLNLRDTDAFRTLVEALRQGKGGS